MDLNHLRSFVAVAQLGHLTRAAETVHLSQPALSSHIKTLEEQFGVTLFERTSSGMNLTPSGRRLLTEVEQIIAAVARLKHSAQDLRGQPTGNLKIGTVLDPAVLRVGDLMLRTLERYPQLELELLQVMSSDGVARVRSGEIDASYYFGVLPADLTGVPLRDIIYRVTLPVAWADKLLDAPWETFAEQPWIVAPEPSSHRQLVMELFGDPVRHPERIIEADTESVINNLVESGVGVSLIRDEIAAQSFDAGRSLIWPGLHVTTKLWLVHAASRAADPLLAAFLEVLGEVWADTPNDAAPQTLPETPDDVPSARRVDEPGKRGSA
jgi:DNA-binding transcriptional LysR family regulator